MLGTNGDDTLVFSKVTVEAAHRALSRLEPELAKGVAGEKRGPACVLGAQGWEPGALRVPRSEA